MVKSLLEISLPGVRQNVEKVINDVFILESYFKYELRSHLDPALNGVENGSHYCLNAVNGICTHQHTTQCMLCDLADKFADSLKNIVKDQMNMAGK